MLLKPIFHRVNLRPELMHIKSGILLALQNNKSVVTVPLSRVLNVFLEQSLNIISFSMNTTDFNIKYDL